MVLVDIFVPSVDKTYNFSLNEDVEIELLIGEITEMVGQREQTHLFGGQSELNLLSIQERRILPKKNTLGECQIKPGTILMLV